MIVFFWTVLYHSNYIYRHVNLTYISQLSSWGDTLFFFSTFLETFIYSEKMRLMKENVMYLNVAKVVEHVDKLSDQLDNHVNVNTVSHWKMFFFFFLELFFCEKRERRERLLILIFFKIFCFSFFFFFKSLK